jgi:hypothetical protein
MLRIPVAAPLLAAAALLSLSPAVAQQPIHVGFLWHMHQPIYYPGENITQTQNAGRFSFSLYDVHNQRFGPYTSWPKNAIQNGQSLPHLGAQVSFSGSLVENLNRLEAAGVNGGMWNNWESSYRTAANLDTSLGNPRMDLVGFGYHHPLMPLLDQRDMRMQIQLHKHMHTQTWGANVPYSKGIFPAETAFSTRMIPALVAEGLEWAIVDSIHIERAIENYPHTNASNLYAPNRADQVNPAIPANQWVQLNNLWAPSKVAAPLAYQPNYTQHVNPSTGQLSKIVAVPAARYEGNEDGRGGFGALQYEHVMNQYRQFNTDPAHPMFVMLHHDGDNFGGGSEAYYNGNWNNMVSWANASPNYDVSTVQDYLDRFPPDPNKVVHVENGSWAGADNGDPEFKKWLGDPNPTTGWSPDRNSWAVLTAAKNHVYTAHDLQIGASAFPNMQNVMTNTGSATERAWHYLLQAQASDHWYWDGTEIWDSNVTRGSNLAVAQTTAVVSGGLSVETTPPSVFLPQRESYNPGGMEWGTQPQPSDFEVWTYAYDVSGLSSVTLKYRVDADGQNPLGSTQNETYAGGAEVGQWVSIPMSSSDVAPPAGILPATVRAPRFGGMITGLSDKLVDYYVEAIDARGNVQKTDIQHVYVGIGNTGTGPGSRVELSPATPQAGESTFVAFNPAGGPLAGATQVRAHVGFNNWESVVSPDALMTWDAQTQRWGLSVSLPTSASQLDLVFNNGAGVWDNNGGADWHFQVQGAIVPREFVMDGVLDSNVTTAATNAGQSVYWALEGNTLYLATEDAGEGNDVFLYLADTPGAMRAANWAKAGQVAGWDAFMADETSNDYEGWFEAPAGSRVATGANGGVLEGTIDLLAEFGTIPAEVWVAVGLFGNADGGALQKVVMAQNTDGSIQANEYVRIVLTQPLAGDYNADGVVDAADYTVWRDTLGSTTQLAADGDRNGTVDAADYVVWRDGYGSTAASMAASRSAAVPEPHTLALVLATWVPVLASPAVRREYTRRPRS